MTGPLPDLGQLLHDAVDDVEPADRIDDIRARAGSSGRGARPWLYAAGGAVLAAAAAVTAFAVLDDPAPSGGDAATTPTAAPRSEPVTAYFLGRTPTGFRLYRETDDAPAGDPLQAALERIQRPPSDPDYQTLWPHGSLVSATVVDGTIEVELGDSAPSAFAGPVEGLPEQQVVYTLQEVAGRLPVQFLRHGSPAGAPVTARPQTEVLSQVLLDFPTEGAAVHGSFVARGEANSFEATVGWQLLDERGAVVKEYSTTATGTGDRLYPWQARIGVRGLPYGFYTFVAMTDDPTGGEGPGPYRDTRTIVVR